MAKGSTIEPTVQFATAPTSPAKSPREDMNEFIPFNKPAIEGREFDYIHDALERQHISGLGDFSDKAVEVLRDAHRSSAVLLTTSCTDALEMSAMMLDLRPGDTVIVPSFTFVSTALAFVREGARIAFADIEPVTLGIDPAHVAAIVDDSVRAVVPVHYGGVGCELGPLQDVLSAHPDVDLIEDNAHGLFGSYRDRPLGTFGRFAALSFHETKNLVCGEGGALVINHPDDVDRAHVIHEKGTNRRSFALGEIDKYSWIDTGSSFALSDLLAAYLLAQLEARDAIMDKRRSAFDRYQKLLAPHQAELGFATPVVPDDRTSAYHMFYVLVADRTTRDRTLEELNLRGVNATFHYVPLHSSPGGERFGRAPVECPVTDDVSGRILRLPFFNAITAAQQERVAEMLIDTLRHP